MPALTIISHNYFFPFLFLCLFPEVLCVSVHCFQAVLHLMERLVLADPAVGETHTGTESELARTTRQKAFSQIQMFAGHGFCLQVLRFEWQMPRSLLLACCGEKFWVS